jgi:hypothetical protein
MTDDVVVLVISLEFVHCHLMTMMNNVTMSSSGTKSKRHAYCWLQQTSTELLLNLCAKQYLTTITTLCINCCPVYERTEHKSRDVTTRHTACACLSACFRYQTTDLYTINSGSYKLVTVEEFHCGSVLYTNPCFM